MGGGLAVRELWWLSEALPGCGRSSHVASSPCVLSPTQVIRLKGASMRERDSRWSFVMGVRGRAGFVTPRRGEQGKEPLLCCTWAWQRGGRIIAPFIASPGTELTPRQSSGRFSLNSLKFYQMVWNNSKRVWMDLRLSRIGFTAGNFGGHNVAISKGDHLSICWLLLLNGGLSGST